MQPVGYVVQRHGFRLTRPIRALNEWFNRMPEEYARNLCGDNEGPYPAMPAEDKERALAIARHYRSLVPMAKEARKPIFHLPRQTAPLAATRQRPMTLAGISRTWRRRSYRSSNLMTHDLWFKR